MYAVNRKVAGDQHWTYVHSTSMEGEHRWLSKAASTNDPLGGTKEVCVNGSHPTTRDGEWRRRGRSKSHKGNLGGGLRKKLEPTLAGWLSTGI